METGRETDERLPLPPPSPMSLCSLAVRNGACRELAGPLKWCQWRGEQRGNSACEASFSKSTRRLLRPQGSRPADGCGGQNSWGEGTGWGWGGYFVLWCIVVRAKEIEREEYLRCTCIVTTFSNDDSSSRVPNSFHRSSPEHCTGCDMVYWCVPFSHVQPGE